MKKIDLHQDIILSFQEDITGFEDISKVHDLHHTYAWGKKAYQDADIEIVRAANRPYHLQGDLQDHQKRKISFDGKLLKIQHQKMQSLCEHYHIRQILKKSDLNSLTNFAILHHVEGIDNLQSLEQIDQLFALGIRSVGFVRNFDNHLAHCNLNTESGLTPLGKQAVQHMQKLWIIVDTAHMNHQSMMDTLSVATKPILNSHSNLRSLTQHPRNVRDEFLDALKENQGVLGLSVYRGFIKNLETPLNINDYLDQISYVIDRIGSDHVALGSDFHGLPVEHCVEGLQHISGLQTLEQAMLKHFWEEICQKFFYKNAMRILETNLAN